jgi:hypothetical protein
MTLVEIKKKTDIILDKELQAKYRRLQEDFLWILANKEKLRNEYANKFIAVENKEVKYSNDTISGIIAKIKQSKRQVEDFAIEYIGECPVNLLF